LLDTTGAPVTLDLKAAKIDSPAATRRVVLPQDGDKVTVFAPATVPEGSEWRFQRIGNKWQLLLRIPPPSKDRKFQVDLNVWVPYRDEPGILRDLLSSK
jgi:hypothetical protein